MRPNHCAALGSSQGNACDFEEKQDLLMEMMAGPRLLPCGKMKEFH